MREISKQLLGEFSGVRYGELRYHDRRLARIGITNGELSDASTTRYCGVGVRALDRGWGFSSTNRLGQEDIKDAIQDAIQVARNVATTQPVNLSRASLAQGRFGPEIEDPVDRHPFEEKLELVRRIEGLARRSRLINSASAIYGEILDHKLILTTDGAEAEVFDSKPEFRISVVAVDGTECTQALEAVGVTGGFADLFARRSPEELCERACDRATRLLKAEYPKGEQAVVILDPDLVGAIVHEAIGHTVEADHVLSGAITRDKIGTRVASDLVTLVDSGPPQHGGHPAGTVLVDDEGVLAQRTVIIEQGLLRSYLHSRETAASFGVEPTGNARAFEYSDEPIIRMRNTYLEPGGEKLSELIQGVKNGYLLKGLDGGGQADMNAEFMFGVAEAYRIQDGRVGELLRGVAISGQAFEVLKSVDGVSRDFDWGLGAGYCGKLQYAKVDAGGPYIRCQAIVGGRQERR